MASSTRMPRRARTRARSEPQNFGYKVGYTNAKAHRTFGGLWRSDALFLVGRRGLEPRTLCLQSLHSAWILVRVRGLCGIRTPNLDRCADRSRTLAAVDTVPRLVPGEVRP